MMTPWDEKRQFEDILNIPSADVWHSMKMIICQETLLIGIDQCRLCLEEEEQIITQWNYLLMSCHVFFFLFDIVNRLFSVCVSIQRQRRRLHLIVLFSLLISWMAAVETIDEHAKCILKLDIMLRWSFLSLDLANTKKRKERRRRRRTNRNSSLLYFLASQSDWWWNCGEER